jgi:sigma-B regulation protein RsbU (phosphoserine phosphatase)
MHLVNNQIVQTTSVEKFATLFYGVYDPKDHFFEYTNAGHNFPILWRKDADHALLKEGGLVIGVLRDTPYKATKIRLRPGDLLVLYTDGVTEARNSRDEEYGEDRLLETISLHGEKAAEAILETIFDSVTAFSEHNLQSDDLTLVVLKVK